MAWPGDPNSVQDAAAGAPLQAARLDIDRDCIMYLGTNRPHCRVYNSSSISVANNTNVALTFNSERQDVGAMHSTSSNTGRITVTDAGFYRVGGGVEFASNGTGRRSIAIRLNGATYIAAHSANADAAAAHQMTISTEYQFAATDYVELVVFQTSGGALNVSVVGNYSPEFSACWVCN